MRISLPTATSQLLAHLDGLTFLYQVFFEWNSFDDETAPSALLLLFLR